MMVFLSPWFLLALGGVGVPIIIHMVHRRRVRHIRFSSTMLLEEIVRRFRSRHRIEEWMVLFLRCAFVVFVVFGVSQPTLRSSAGLGPDCACVVLLDDTYSMAARDGEQTRFDRAITYAREVLSVMTRRDRVALLCLSNPSRLLTSPDPTILARRLEGTKPVADRADLRTALNSALSFLGSAKSASRLLVVLGDIQSRTYKVLNDRAVRDTLRRQNVYILFINCSEKVPPSATITHLTLQRDPQNPHFLLLKAVLKNLYVKTLNLRVELKMGSRRMPLAPVSVPSGGMGTVTTRIPAAQVRIPRPAYLRLEGDAVDADNTFYFIAKQPTKVPILLVNGDPSPLPELDECFYLRHAICPRDPKTGFLISDFTVDETDVWGLRGRNLKDYGVVVLANVRKLDAITAKKMVEFLSDGGGMVLFFGECVDVGWWDGFLRGLCGVGVKGKKSFGEAAKMGRIEWDHPVFEPFLGMGMQSFSALRVRRAVVLDSSDGVLANLDDGTPFLLESSSLRGRLLIFSTTADRDWTNLPLRPAFLVLLHAALSHIAKKAPSTLRLIGDPITLKVPTSDALLRAPSGRRRRLKADGNGYITFVPDEQGIWRLKSGEEESLFAVNLRREEADLWQVRLSPFSSGRIMDCPKGLATTLRRMRTGMKLEWLFFLLATIALLSELLLANRRLPGMESKG